MARSTESIRFSSEERSGRRIADEAADSAARNARMSTSSFTQVIEVMVGKDKTSFFVHPRIIASMSPFFDAALKRWKTADEPITLSDDEPHVFDAYLMLLYDGNFTTPWNQLENFGVELRLLLQLYILADKLGDLANADMVINRTMRHLWAYVPDIETLLPAWQSTAPESPLRRLLVDAIAMKSGSRILSKQLGMAELPKDLVVAIALKLAAFVGVGEIDGEDVERSLKRLFAMTPKCTYHQHEVPGSACEDSVVGN
ncbi:hypothetical protein LTR12_016527 [Friedmanniomyces endolithicus]|nr:hypothetical protein LTR74_003176 [Friedmanniomyces endolithicus]KAK1809119.1 hypothetical protein LTR12_016527 [Friedmanniomyces endolithicus]